MVWFGIFAGLIIVGALSLFLFFNSQVDKESANKTAEFANLKTFAQTEKQLEAIITYANKTRFNEITFYKSGSTNSYIGSTEKALTEIKKGAVVFSDPKDNPLMYTRPFLRVEFEDGIVLKIEDGNLG